MDPTFSLASDEWAITAVETDTMEFENNNNNLKNVSLVKAPVKCL